MPQDPVKLTATLNKKKVPELKEDLEARGLPTSGLKAVLISRLVEDIIKKEEAEAEKSASQENAPSNDKEEETAQHAEEIIQPPTEQKGSPVKEKESPERRRSPSPVEEKREEPKARSESKSPQRKQRTPSPAREPMEEEQGSKDEENKKRKAPESASNNGKRQRKWESRGGQNEISISSDTLDSMITDIPQSTPAVTNDSATRDIGGARTDRRVVLTRREKEKEKDDLPPDQRPPVPPPRRPETRTLYVDHFVRPFLPKHVKDLLEKTGKVEYFWMNNIRSHCYVTYENVEQAVATRDAIYGLMWPPANKSRLIAEFATEEEALKKAQIAKAREEPAQPLKPSAVPQQTTPVATLTRSAEAAVRDSTKERERDRERDVAREQRDRERERERGRNDRDRDGRQQDRDRVDRDRERRDRPPPPPKVTLEQLFKKTTARPCIYWAPLTDQEIADKKTTSTTTTTKA